MTNEHSQQPIDIGDKPTIPNIVFKEMIEAIERGDRSVADEMVKIYSMDPAQRSFLLYKLELNNL